MKKPLLWTYKPLIILFTIFTSLSIVGCKDDKPLEIQDLVFPLDTYYISEGSEISLHINQGNNKYHIQAEDTTLITARADGSVWPAGRLFIKGLQKGSTVLKVTDEKTEQEVNLTIHVVDPFLVFKVSQPTPVVKQDNDYRTQDVINEIRTEALTFAPFKQESIIVLHRNAEKAYFIFDTLEDLKHGNIEQSGKYELSFNYGGPNKLVLDDNENEQQNILPIHVNNQWAFQTLYDFAQNPQEQLSTFSPERFLISKQNLAVAADSPTEYFDRYFHFYIDLTSYFQAKYPDTELEFVQLFQSTEIFHDFHNFGVEIGDGILK